MKPEARARLPRPALWAVRLHCQRPGCDEKMIVPLTAVNDAEMKSGWTSVSADGEINARTVLLPESGWGLCVDDKGILYAVCPADNHKPDPPSEKC